MVVPQLSDLIHAKDTVHEANGDKQVPPASFNRAVIHFTNGSTERPAYWLKLLKTSLDDETLADLRTNIAGLTGSIEISNFPFCTKDGAIVQDMCPVQEYLVHCIDHQDKDPLRFYMKDMLIVQREAMMSQEKVSSVLDAEKLSIIKNKVNDEAFKQLTGTAAKYIPELEQRDWAIIEESNALCYGIRVIRAQYNVSSNGNKDSRGVPVGIERARSRAFRLRKRSIMSDSIPSSTVEGVQLSLRIPDYIIDDKSYVSIYETTTEMQDSMATSSFSETDVAAAASASFNVFSGSASMSFAETSSQAAASTSSRNSKKVTIAYNFPRVTLFLDNRSLELTPACEEALRQITTLEQVHKFQDEYGEFFSSRVQLGGRLFATEDVDESFNQSSKEKIKDMKAAAAVSFSGWGISASVSAGHGEGESEKSSKADKTARSSLTWQANGGDTLLANQPTAWAPTVSYHWNWRVTKQDHIAGLFDVASSLKGMSWLVDEAKSWGLAVNPKAVGVSKLMRKGGSRFYVRSHNTPYGRYLQVFSPEQQDLTPAAELVNAHKGRSVANMSANLRSRGALVLTSKTREGPAPSRIWQAEDVKTGKPVDEVRYNTPYYLFSRQGKVTYYADHHRSDGIRFGFGNTNRACSYNVRFLKDDGTESTEVVPEGGKFFVQWYRDGKKYGLLECISYTLTGAVACVFGSEGDDASKAALVMEIHYE